MSSLAFLDAVATECADIPSIPRKRPTEPVASYVSADGEHSSTVIWGAFPRLQVSTVLKAPARLYRLRGMFVVEVSNLEDGTVYAKHRSLPVYGYGQDVREALAAFAEAFDVQWRMLVEEDDDELLSGHARSLKNELRAAVSDASDL
jgi:hypothetical protein